MTKTRAATASTWSGSACTGGLTHDQAIVGELVVKEILADVCGCSLRKVGEAEVPGEAVMRSVLFVEWGNGVDAATAAGLAKLSAGEGAVTAAEAKAVMSVIGDTIQSDFVSPTEGKLPSIMKRWYKRAKKGIIKGATKDIDFAFREADELATKWLADHHMYWVGDYYDKHLSDALSKHVAAGMKDGLGRSAIGDSLEKFFVDYPGVANKPASYWRSFAANGMNRTRQFGNIQAYDELDIIELVVLAVMDERTSAVCRNMNGRVIPVQACVGQRDMLMAAEDPEDVKTIAPWPKIESLMDRKTKDVLADGVITPPYHGNCRTNLVER